MDGPPFRDHPEWESPSPCSCFHMCACACVCSLFPLGFLFFHCSSSSKALPHSSLLSSFRCCLSLTHSQGKKSEVPPYVTGEDLRSREILSGWRTHGVSLAETRIGARSPDSQANIPSRVRHSLPHLPSARPLCTLSSPRGLPGALLSAPRRRGTDDALLPARALGELGKGAQGTSDFLAPPPPTAPSKVKAGPMGT